MAEEGALSVAGFDIRIAWQRNDAGIEADAIEMWTRLDILPPEVRPEDRAKQLAAAAYSEGQIAAVATGVVEYIDFLRARFLVMRSMTAPEFRRTHAQVALALPTMTMLEQWSKANPNERIAGLIGFVEPGAWGEAARMPWGPYFGWTLVAYTHDGKQVRVVWFDHYRIES
ncbi:MAG TPA: hypothetical protein VEC11_10390 [Allosphingosinicella sp.]|nr:hypothetical protein [Allosphingosinicella sp.]